MLCESPQRFFFMRLLQRQLPFISINVKVALILRWPLIERRDSFFTLRNTLISKYIPNFSQLSLALQIPFLQHKPSRIQYYKKNRRHDVHKVQLRQNGPQVSVVITTPLIPHPSIVKTLHLSSLVSGRVDFFPCFENHSMAQDEKIPALQFRGLTPKKIIAKRCVPISLVRSLSCHSPTCDHVAKDKQALTW